MRTTTIQVGKGFDRFDSVVAVSPDGSQIVTGGEELQLWDIDGEPILKLDGHTSFVTRAKFSRDGKWIASSSHDRSVRIWDRSTGEERLRLVEHGPVFDVVLSPNSSQVASGSTDGVSLWDLNSGQRVASFKTRTLATYVAFSRDGRWLICNRAIWRIHPVDSMALLGHTNPVKSIAFSPTGAELATSSSIDTIKVWDVVTGLEKMTLNEGSEKSPEAWFVPLSFEPSGDRLVSGHFDGALKVWDTRTGLLTRTLVGHSDQIASVSFGPNGDRLVSCSFDKTIKVWDAITGKEVFTIDSAPYGAVCATFSPDGKRIVSSLAGITLWDAVTGAKEREVKGHFDAVANVAFSADGERIVSGSKDRTVRIWDVASGRELLRLTGHTEMITSVAFGPDGKRVISGSLDGTVRVWNSATGDLLLNLEEHVGEVNCVVFSPDGTRIASGSTDGTILVREATDRQPRRENPSDQ